MTYTKIIFVFLIATIFSIAFPLSDAYAAAYIKFDGVDGESKDKDHQGWSDLLSFSQGLHQPGGGKTGSTRQRGDVIMDDITLKKELDKASPKLAASLAIGKTFPTVEFELTSSTTDTGRTTYYAYELTNVRVTSYSVSGSGQSETVPVEDFSLNFEEIKVTYTELDDRTGSPKTLIGYECTTKKNECSQFEIEVDSVGDDIDPTSFESDSTQVPKWLETNLQWYKDGLITEPEMFDSIFHLIDENII